MAAASYTNASSGPANAACARLPFGSCCNQLAKQASQLPGFLCRQPGTEVLVDGGRIDGPHLAPQLPALGGDDQHVAAPILAAWAPLDQTLPLQAIDQSANVVLGELGAILHTGLAQHAL